MDEPENPGSQPNVATKDAPHRTSEPEGEADHEFGEDFDAEQGHVDNSEQQEEDGDLDGNCNESSLDASPHASPDKGGANPGRSNDQLEAFRQQWHVELQQRPSSGSREQSPRSGTSHSVDDAPGGNNSDINTNQIAMDIEDQARAYFIQGMEAEDDRQLTEAIYFYRKALQLVPDIESKLGNLFNRSPRDRARQDSESSVEGNEEELLESLDKLKLEEEGLCQMDYEQRMTHISCLPVELVIYILHWVVSNDLDLRSLEMFSRVCKGFYLCGRDERVWRKACLKVWGLNLGTAKKYGASWRRMMIERPHLLYDGCYISKVTYVRQGEQSIDSFYRPFHLVEYYRYLRFFPDGHVLMFVSPEDPLQSLPKLKTRNSKAPGILMGGYRLADRKVTCLLKRVHTDHYHNTYRFKRQQRQANNNPTDKGTSYVVECDIVSSGRRAHAQLMWTSYSIRNVSKVTGEETISQFDLNKRNFPNLIFSRVKSYVFSASEPLT